VRNKCVGLVRTAKDEYLDKQAAILDSPSPSFKNWWKLLKNLSGIPSINSVYPPLNIDGQIIENHVDKANCFNNYFVNSLLLTILVEISLLKEIM
jgi:hypothetical protein